jgi:hypothetical protein
LVVYPQAPRFETKLRREKWLAVNAQLPDAILPLDVRQIFALADACGQKGYEHNHHS